jgi:fucose 4-O-acetylase-like acetyltransferase
MPRAPPTGEDGTPAERASLVPAPAGSIQDAGGSGAGGAAKVEEAAAGREAFFDNAKGLTVLVVILSHTMMSYTSMFDVAVLRACFPMGALVAMPAFSFLSGHLSSADLTPRRMVSILKMLVVFVVYQILYFIAEQADAAYPKPKGARWMANPMGARREPGLPLPVWNQENVSWFLLCLVAWRASLPLFARLHRPISVSIALATLALLLDEGKNFMPIFGFLPFFIIGHTYSREELWAMRSPTRAAACFALPFAVLIVLSCAAGDEFAQAMHPGGKGQGGGPHAALGLQAEEWMPPGHGHPSGDGSAGGAGAGGEGAGLPGVLGMLFIVPLVVVMGGFGCLYDQSGDHDKDMGGDHRRQLGDGVGLGCYDVGVPLRLVFYGLSLLALMGWLSLIPRRRVRGLTNAGAFSLYAYLLHPFVIWYTPWVQSGVHWLAAHAGGQALDEEISNAGGVLVVLLFVLLVWAALSSAPARLACVVCTEPAIEGLFLDPEAPTPSLNKEGGAAMRVCWPACACCCCAALLDALGCCTLEGPRRALAIALPAGAVPGQQITVEAPWGRSYRVAVPADGQPGQTAHFLV